MRVRSDVWMAEGLPGAKEMQAFYERLGKVYAGALGGGPALSPAASGMTEAMKQMMKQGGVPLENATSISGIASPAGSGDANAPFLQTQSNSSHFAASPIDLLKFKVPEGYTEEKRRGRE